MRLLWLCNTAPGVVRSHISGKPTGGVNWVDHVLSGLRCQGLTIRILFRGEGGSAQLDDSCGYAAFSEPLPHRYYPELEKRFREEIRTFRPDVIHSWGLEYGHTLAMVNAAQAEGNLPCMAASIQGLCGFIARHYAEGIPEKVQRSATFRDIVRRDNIRQQREKYVLRGRMEAQAMKTLSHVIGRTDWDRACAKTLNPDIAYHFCGETLREPFYQGGWRYDTCCPHRIFASSCEYPVKGFHYLLEAFSEVLKTYPDATLAVPGRSFLPDGAQARLRRGSYEKYLETLAKQWNLTDKIEFLGDLSGEEMKMAYVSANVFVLPSTIENSPNSLGEAMLLGVPCVASDVGGVSSLMRHGSEGRIYQSTAPYMLAYHIQTLFAMGPEAASLGQAARAHAQVTHDPERNLETLLAIYEELAGGGNCHV